MQANGTNAGYGAYGGAVHVQNENDTNKGKLILSGGTMIGNTCTGTGETSGAGIYLAANNKGIATMELFGAPAFGTDVNGSTAAKTDDANTVTKSGYSSKQNGQDSVYTGNKVRQDIFIAENSGAAPQSIVITGDLVSSGGTYIGDGSIWVWAEKDTHSKQLMPFAKLGTGVEFYTKQSDSDTIPAGKFNAAHLKAFRNAQDDGATENATDTYLYGTLEGDAAAYIYWTGIGGFRKVILRKVDNTYASVNDRSFTIYKGTSTEAYTPKGETASLSGLTSGTSGCFWIGELPYGTYIIEETTPHRWFYVIVDETGTCGTLFTDSDGKEKDKIGGYESRTAAENAAKAKSDAIKAAKAS